MSSPPAFPHWLRKIDPVLARQDGNAVYQAFRLRRRDHRPPWHRRWFAAEYKRASFRGGGRLLKPSRQSRFPAWASNLITDRGYSQATLEVWLTPTTGEELAEAIYLESREHWAVDIFAALILFGVPLAIYVVAALVYLNHSAAAVALMSAAWLWLAWEGTLFGLLVAGRAARSAVAHRFHIIERVSQPSKGIAHEVASLMGGCLAVVGIAAVGFILLIASCFILVHAIIFAAGFVEDVMPPAISAYLFEAGLIPVCALMALILRGARPGMTRTHEAKCRRVFAKCQRAYALYLSRRVIDDFDAWAWVVSLYGPEPAFKQLHMFSTPD
ncbi:MAG: hypothetical protein RLY93_00780 [Sumerlaeia bacterium]